MGYTYAIMPDKMFEDRFEEFVTLGTPRSDVEEMRKRITDMWADARGLDLRMVSTRGELCRIRPLVPRIPRVWLREISMPCE